MCVSADLENAGTQVRATPPTQPDGRDVEPDGSGPDASGPGGGGSGGTDPERIDIESIDLFAETWLAALARTSHVPFGPDGARSLLRRLTTQMVDALACGADAPTGVGEEIGTALVEANVGHASALGETVTIVAELPRLCPQVATDVAAARVLALQAGVATGYARATRLLADKLRHEATHDSLTRLPNRALFFTWLEEIFDHAQPGDRLGVCYVDLDGFKTVNDTLGHDAGDELLAAAAARMDSCVSQLGHRIARVGGDEFALLIAHCAGVGECTAVADAVLTALRAPVQLAGRRMTVSASIGIVERSVRGATMGEVMKAADQSLYWAKAAGKDRWTIYDPERNAHLTSRQALSAALPAALRRGEFVLEYQPVARLRDGAMAGAEALVRWRHPRLGRLMPERFVRLAEETGVIVALGTWILREACRRASHWQPPPAPDRPPRGAGPSRANNNGAHPEPGGWPPTSPRTVSVNLAARQLRERGLVDAVGTILAETGLAPTALQLELNESTAMGVTGESLRTLRELAGLGVRITIDDFGTGSSNLSRLRELPIHGLKLAGSFVDGLRTQQPDVVAGQIVRSLVDVAHALGWLVTAEGVDEADQAERLRELGCDLAQGFHFARPVAADLIDDLMRDQPPAHWRGPGSR
jgi:diguanylate cyclase (GGDEF)-like protein